VLLAVSPGLASGRLVSATLAKGPAPRLLESLARHALAGTLMPEATVAVMRGLAELGEIERAVAIGRLSVNRGASDIALRPVLAALLRRMNDSNAARTQLEAALAIAPQDEKVLRAIGRLEVFEENFARAEGYLRQAMAAHPKAYRAHVELGRCLLQQKRFDDAADVLRAAARRFPTRSEIPARLGTVLRFCGRGDEAVPALSRAIELDPEDGVALVELAGVHEELGDLARAVELHRRASDVRGKGFNATIFCHALLAAGRAREAWATNTNRIESTALRELPGIRAWNGEPLGGKSLIVIGEGGTGDQIRDACVHAEAITTGARVTITCEPRLLPLFARSFPRARFLPVKADQRVAPYERMLSRLIDEPTLAVMKESDYCVLSPDLLGFFRGEDRLWEGAGPYLTPAPELLDRWRGRVAELGPGLKVGISWRSGALYYNRECYYTRLLEWGRILTTPGVHFVNLQYDESAHEVRAAERAFGARIHVWNDLDLKDDFDGLSALIRHLDLVLAPNTTVLELAGALGVTGWYMNRVPIAYDHWRRKDSTGQDRLYPSVRQIRGERPWDTPSLVANVATGIRTMAGKTGAATPGP
jgi:Tfp pilus assembly protein PilF